MSTPLTRIRAALRRSRRLILVSVLVCVAANVAVAQITTPQYQAKSAALLSDRDIGSIVTASSTPDQDLQRVSATNELIAQAPGFYQAVARRVGLPATAWHTVRDELTPAAEQGTSVLDFTSKASTPGSAIRLANAAVAAFPAWRAQVVATPIRQAREALQQSIASSHTTSPQLQESLARLRVLERTAVTGAGVVDSATQASRLRPNPPKDGLIGLTSGLVIGLLLMALREGLYPRLRDDRDVEEVLGVPVIGQVRTARPGRGRRRGAGAPIEVGYDRAALALSRRAASQAGTVIAVVSALPGEGRTATTAGLAHALARRGDDVCVIDCDSVSPDLPEMLARAIPGRAREAIVAASRANGGGPVATLDRAAIAIREIADGGSVALARWDPRRSESATKVVPPLTSLRRDYDWILLDTPAVSQSARAEEVAARADRVVAVVRPDVISRRALGVFAHETASWARRPSSAILNALDP